jgi:hypothetical protein
MEIHVEHGLALPVGAVVLVTTTMGETMVGFLIEPHRPGDDVELVVGLGVAEQMA